MILYLIYGELADICINDRIYCDNTKALTMIDLMVKETDFWYWYCSPLGFNNNNNKKWKSTRKKDLKIRLDFIKTIAQKTNYAVNDEHVKGLSEIPNKNHKFIWIKQ